MTLKAFKINTFKKKKTKKRLVPKQPESIWLNWATALIAQAGWTLYESAHTEPDPSADYEKDRDSWAEQVLLSAALHTRRAGPATLSTKRKQLRRYCSLQRQEVYF